MEQSSGFIDVSIFRSLICLATTTVKPQLLIFFVLNRLRLIESYCLLPPTGRCRPLHQRWPSPAKPCLQNNPKMQRNNNLPFYSPAMLRGADTRLQPER